MTLQEFLATANADNAAALTQAQAHTESSPHLYTANVLTAMLVGAGVYGTLADTSTTTGHLMAQGELVRGPYAI